MIFKLKNPSITIKSELLAALLLCILPKWLNDILRVMVFNLSLMHHTKNKFGHSPVLCNNIVNKFT